MRVVSAIALSLVLPGLVHADNKPLTIKVGKLSATAPSGWTSEKPSNRLRSYQIKLAGEKGGPGDGELIVMPESDPKAEKVFPRWKTQFVPPDGKSVDDISKASKLDGVKGATINILNVNGNWRYKERPFDPRSKEVIKENYRVVWVIVNDGDEATHIRLSGPKATIDHHYPAFEKWLRSLK